MSTDDKYTDVADGGLLKSTSVVGSMTILSRISGLARDIGFAHWFGASIVMDAFFVAFKIPNLLRRFFAEGAFSQAFVPVIAEYRANCSGPETRELLDRVTGTLGAVVFLITAAGVAAAPILIMIFAPGFLGDDGRYDMATDMLRFTFPYLFFISLTALAGGILNTFRRFAVPAFTPVLLNLVLISFAAWVAPGMERPAMGLALGVFVAGAVQLLFQLPFLLQLGMLPLPKWGWAHEGVKRILKLMLPVIFGSSVAQINLLFDTLIASFLAAGSISWLYYSDRLMEFPLGVFGIAVATVMLPHLSEHHAKASPERFSASLDWALRLVLLIAAPAALGLVVLARPLLTTLFYGGAFTANDVTMATASLLAYAVGLLGFILVKVLSTGFFSRQDTRSPVRIGVMAVVLNMALNVVFVVAMVRSEFYAPHVGLALATTLSSLFNAVMLFRGLRREGVYRPGLGWSRFGSQVIVATVVMSAAVVWVRDRAGDWLAMSLAERVWTLAVCVLGGIFVYFAACLVVGLRPASLRSQTSAQAGSGGPP
ncbi:MAG TPA: murein biosynthesis integral membrane protein MurJ [Gammaproteobacteria bacterium]